MIKRSLILSLLMLLVVVAACSSPANQGGSNSNSSSESSGEVPEQEEQEEVTLTFSLWGDDNRITLFEDLISDFTAEHPHINVNLTLIPEAEYQQRISTMIASHTAPDVAWFSEAMVAQFLEAGHLLDISAIEDDPAYEFDDLIPTALDFYRQGDSLYGVPFTNPPKALFFNKTLFEEKGLETPLELYEQGEWTYDKLYEVARELTDSDNGIYGLNLYGLGWSLWSGALIETIWAYGGDIFNEDGTEFVLNSPESAEVFQMLSDMMFEDKVHLSPGDQTTFESGRVAMVRNNVSYAANARNIDGFEWDIAPMPEGSVENSPAVVGMAGYSVMEDTEHPEEAMELLKFLTGPEGMKRVSETFVPNRTSILESDEYLNANELPSAEATQAAVVDPMKTKVRVQPMHVNWQQIDVTIKTILDDLYAEKTSVEEMLQRMDDEVTPLLQ